MEHTEYKIKTKQLDDMLKIINRGNGIDSYEYEELRDISDDYNDGLEDDTEENQRKLEEIQGYYYKVVDTMEDFITSTANIAI